MFLNSKRGDENMIIKSVLFRRKKKSPLEKGICIQKDEDFIFVNENMEIIGTENDRGVWDSIDTYDYVTTIDFDNIR